MIAKKFLGLLLLVTSAGCDFRTPLALQPEGKIEREWVGLWRRTTKDAADKEERLLVLPLAEDAYLVVYPAGEPGAMFGQAVPVRWGERMLTQIRWVGTGEGRLPEDDRVYQLAEGALEGNRLKVRLINPDVVGRAVTTPEELRRALDEHAADPRLWREPLMFDRLPE
jgi:hypothetical protein